MRWSLLSMCTRSIRIHTYPSPRVLPDTTIKLLDAHITSEVQKALGGLITAKTADSTHVSILCKGLEKRRMVISYMLENPVWKSSYRLYITNTATADNNNNNSTAKHTYSVVLEGWACVDNESEDDWADVSMSLVSGSPISFKYEMYNPTYGIRAVQFDEQGYVLYLVTWTRS